MRKVSWISGLLGLLSSGAWALEMEVPETLPDEPFDIRAARFEYTNDTFYASGGVTGRFENVVMTADHLSGNPDSGDLHVEGDIHVERGKVIWDGSTLDYNYITDVGNFGPSTFNVDPILMSVGRIERVSTNEYLLHDATFTTCPKEGHPHYRIAVKDARLVDNKYLNAKGATFYVGNVPVFYFPFWRQTLGASVFTFKLGQSSEWGAYGMVRATIPLSAESESLTDLNIYTRRGVGLGQGFRWNSEESTGTASAFYLADQDPHAKYSDPEIGTDRYRLKLEEIYRFSDTHYVNTKWNYLSDPEVLKEYNRSEYRYYPQPENYASWVYGNRLGASEVFVNHRLNDFYNNTDRVEWLGDLYRMRLGNSPLYFQSANRMAYLEQVFSDTNLTDRIDSVRLDSANALYLPHRFGVVNVIPRAVLRGTYYSKSAVGTSDEFRGIYGAGMEVSMQAAKTLSEAGRWYGTGLRHTLEPYLDYSYAGSSVETNRLYQFDSLDALGDENRVRLGLRNLLQTKRGDRVVRLVDLDVYTHYLFDRNGSDADFDSLFVAARFPLTDRIVFDVDGELDWNAGAIPFLNSRFAYRRNDEILISLEHLYRAAENQSLWSPRVDLYPDERFSLFGYGRYDDRQGELEEIAIGGYVSRCCMRYGLGVHLYDDGEASLMFSIGLSAFPEASISSGL